MRKYTGLALMLLLLVSVLVVLADEDSNDKPDDYSLCDDVWYCPDPDNPEREEWNWVCGFYLGQLLVGRTAPDEVPEWCLTQESEEGFVYPDAGCYDDPSGGTDETEFDIPAYGYPDAMYYGVPNSLGNIQVFFGSTNGDCDGYKWSEMAVLIFAADQATAEILCAGFYPAYTMLMPAPWDGLDAGYFCIESSEIP